MTISILEAATAVCTLGKWKVSNLQLQKILYLASMMYMGKNNGEPLIDQNFEAWDYGPVEPNLYHQFKMYGSDPIRSRFFDLNIDSIKDTKEYEELKQAVEYLIQQKPSRLVSLTHRKGGAWEKNYNPNRKGVVIPNKDIFAEYKELIRDKQQREQ